MIQITPQMRILVAIEAVDGRKGIDSLARLCQEKLPSRRQSQPRDDWGSEENWSDRELPYSGKPAFFRRAFTRGSPRMKLSSGSVSVRPTRPGPKSIIRSRALMVLSLSRRPA